MTCNLCIYITEYTVEKEKIKRYNAIPTACICFREVQFVVLSNIASMSIRRKGLFEPYLKSFYVRSNDAQQVKLLKVNV